MKARKKLIAGLMAAMIIATIGAVYATDQTDGTTPDTPSHETLRDKHDMNRMVPFACNLTIEQQTELQQLITTLRDQNATSQEIRAAIQQKLEEFGVFDAQLENQIAQTEQRLAILNREKELRDEGYNWTDIRTMIQNEFNMTGGLDMIPGFGLSCGSGRGGPHGFPPMHDQNMTGYNRPPMGDQNMTDNGQHTMYRRDFGREPHDGSSNNNPSTTTES